MTAAAQQLPPAPVPEEPSEPNPSAWLVTGGCIFKDRAFISEEGAEKSASDRNDGASVEPLYLCSQPAVPAVEALAQFIRKVDGNNDMGAGSPAEHICNWIVEGQKQ